MPMKHRDAKTIKETVKPCTKSAWYCSVTWTLPTYAARTTVVTPMLIICPVTLMVARVAEATPYNLFSTEVMTAFMFGEAKRARPKPRSAKLPIMSSKLPVGITRARRSKAVEVMAIPVEAMILGSLLSESFPARGENPGLHKRLSHED